jgi:hypothetical protein
MKKFHIAISVSDINLSVEDYSRRFECRPSVVIPNEYALWRTATLNFSIRKVTDGSGTLRHFGWEDSLAFKFEKETDVNGIMWEKFSEDLQKNEIEELWPK